ncbi:MAG TPA: hypothetical protein PLK90_08335 [Clostridiales bacterium]|nr:hypothetical protein [Clostridiales bacterium]HQP70389.1 hypothetical protein [Clostridiales bacterium]
MTCKNNEIDTEMVQDAELEAQKEIEYAIADKAVSELFKSIAKKHYRKALTRAEIILSTLNDSVTPRVFTDKEEFYVRYSTYIRAYCHLMVHNYKMALTGYNDLLRFNESTNAVTPDFVITELKEAQNKSEKMVQPRQKQQLKNQR